MIRILIFRLFSSKLPNFTINAPEASHRPDEATAEARSNKRGCSSTMIIQEGQPGQRLEFNPDAIKQRKPD